MSVMCTVAASEQKSHFIAITWLLALLELLNAVAQPSRLLVILLRHRVTQRLAQLNQFRLAPPVRRHTLGHLATMLRLSVNILKQRHQLVAKCIIIMRTTEPPG